MRILFGSCCYFPRCGGAERSFMRLIAETARQHQVCVITQETEGVGRSRTYRDSFGNRVVRVPYYFHGPERLDSAIDEKVFERVEAVARRFRPDLIHGSYLDHFCFSLSQVAAHLRLPYVQTLCGSDLILSGADAEVARMAALTLRNSAAVITKSEDLKRLTVRQYPVSPKAVTIIPNGVDLNGPATPPPDSQRRAYALAVGNAKWTKGYEFLCGVAEIVARRCPWLKICIVGDGPDLGRIQNLRYVRRLRQLTLLGPQSAPEIMCLLDSALFMIVTSHYEGCPNAVLEAFSRGRCVVAFDTFGLRGLIEHGRNGLLAPYPDIAALAAHVETLARNQRLRNAMGETARRVVAAKQYRWSTVAAQVADLYARLQRRGKNQ